MTHTLFDISARLLEIVSLIEQEGGEANEILLDGYLESLEYRDIKLNDYAGLIKHLEGRIQLRRAHIREQQENLKADQALVDRLKSRLKDFFIRHGEQKIDTGQFRITLAGHGGVRPVTLHVKAEALPDHFQRVVTTYRADLDGIRHFLESLEQEHGLTELTGEDGTLYAELGERGSSIRIK